MARSRATTRQARPALHVPQLQGLFRIDPTVEPDEVAFQIERTWDQIAAPLYQFLKSLQEASEAEIAAGAPTGVPSGLGNENAEGSSNSLPRLDHQHKRDVRAKAAGLDVATRNALDFQDTAQVLWTITDDPGNDEVDIQAGIAPGVLLSQEADIVPPGSFSSSGAPARQRATVVFVGTYVSPVVTVAWEDSNRRFTVENLTATGMTLRSSTNALHSGDVYYDVHEEGAM